MNNPPKFPWSRPQDYSSHKEPAHGTYSGYVDGCRRTCCDVPEHRAQYDRDYPQGVPEQRDASDDMTVRGDVRFSLNTDCTPWTEGDSPQTDAINAERERHGMEPM